MSNVEISQRTILGFKAALDTRRERLAAMTEDQIMRRLRIDVPATCTAIITAVHDSEELREEIAETFGAEGVAILDGLEETARAARQADAEFAGRDEGVDAGDVHKEVLEVHARLLADADSLVVRGILAPARVATFRDARSHQGALGCLVGLVALFRESWGAIVGHSPTTEADLAAAEELALRFDAAIAAAPASAARETRIRMLSVLVREYEELRRMVAYLRHFMRDAERFAPSIYAGRGRKPGGASDPEDAEDGLNTGADSDASGPVAGPTAGPVAGPTASPVTGPVPNNGGPAFGS